MRRSDSALLARRIVSASVALDIVESFERVCRANDFHSYDVIRDYMQRFVAGEPIDLEVEFPLSQEGFRKFTFYENRRKAAAFFACCYGHNLTVSHVIASFMVHFVSTRSE